MFYIIKVIVLGGVFQLSWSFLNSKQLLLCCKYSLEFESGIYFFLDYSKFNLVFYNVSKSKDGHFKFVVYGKNYTI